MSGKRSLTREDFEAVIKAVVRPKVINLCIEEMKRQGYLLVFLADGDEAESFDVCEEVLIIHPGKEEDGYTRMSVAKFKKICFATQTIAQREAKASR